jgi:hypothetical protein
LWLPSRIFEKKIDLCKNYAEIRAFDGKSKPFFKPLLFSQFATVAE